MKEQTRKALRHLIKRKECRAFFTWRDNVRDLLDMKHSMKRCVITLSKIRTERKKNGFDTWQRFQRNEKQIEQRRDRLLLTVQARLFHRATSKALAKWKEFKYESIRNKRLMKRAILTFRKKFLFTKFQEWKYFIQLSLRKKDVGKRVLLRFSRRQVASAFRTWTSLVYVTRTGNDRQIQAKNYALIQKCVRRFTHRTLSIGFWKWSETTKSFNQRRTILLKILKKWKRKYKANGLSKWRDWTYQDVRRASFAKRMVRRWKQRHLNPAMRKWINETKRQQRIIHLLTSTLVKKYYQHLERSVKQWRQHTMQSRHMSEVIKLMSKQRRERIVRMTRRIMMLSAARAFDRWNAACRESITKKSCLLRMTIINFLKRRMATSLRTWRDNVREMQRLRHVGKKWLLKALHKRMSQAYTSWKEYTRDAIRQRGIVRRATLKRWRFIKKQYYQRWCCLLQDLKNRRKKKYVVLQKIFHSMLARGWRAWILSDHFIAQRRARILFYTTNALRKQRRFVLARFVRRWRERTLVVKKKRRWTNLAQTHSMQVQLRRAFQQWRRLCVVRTRARRILQRCKSRMTRQLLDRGWRTWCKHDGRQFVQRIRDRYIWKTTKRMMERGEIDQKKKFYCYWRDQARERQQQRRVTRRRLSTMIKRWRSRSLVQSWERWIVQVRKEKQRDQGVLRILRLFLKSRTDAMRGAVMKMKHWSNQKFHSRVQRQDALLQLSSKLFDRVTALHRRFYHWKSTACASSTCRRVLLRVSRLWNRRNLSSCFRTWSLFSRQLWERAMEEVVSGRNIELDNMFEAREALRRWKYFASLIDMEERYTTQVSIHEQRVHVMLSKFRQIKLPTHLNNANKLHKKTLRQLRSILGSLQNIDFTQSKRHVWMPSGTSTTAEMWWKEGMRMDVNLEAMHARKVEEAMLVSEEASMSSCLALEDLEEEEEEFSSFSRKISPRKISPRKSSPSRVRKRRSSGGGGGDGKRFVTTNSPLRLLTTRHLHRISPGSTRDLSHVVQTGFVGTSVIAESPSISNVTLLYGDRTHRSADSTMQQRMNRSDRHVRSGINSPTHEKKKRREFSSVFDLAREYKEMVEVAQDAIVEEAVHDARSKLRSRLRESVLEMTEAASAVRGNASNFNWEEEDEKWEEEDEKDGGGGGGGSGGSTRPLATTRTFSTLSQQWSPMPPPSERFDHPEEKSSFSLSYRHPDSYSEETSMGMASMGARHGIQ